MDKWYESEESGLNKSLPIFAIDCSGMIFVLIPTQPLGQKLAWFSIQNGVYNTSLRFTSVDAAVNYMSGYKICNGDLTAKLHKNWKEE